jgi:hypothetical protein
MEPEKANWQAKVARALLPCRFAYISADTFHCPEMPLGAVAKKRFVPRRIFGAASLTEWPSPYQSSFKPN